VAKFAHILQNLIKERINVILLAMPKVLFSLVEKLKYTKDTCINGNSCMVMYLAYYKDDKK